MTRFKAGDWVTRKPLWQNSHPFWKAHKDTPIRVTRLGPWGLLELGDIGLWNAEFFNPCPPPSMDLGEWL